jgi:hypothetical protein
MAIPAGPSTSRSTPCSISASMSSRRRSTIPAASPIRSYQRSQASPRSRAMADRPVKRQERAHDPEPPDERGEEGQALAREQEQGSERERHAPANEEHPVRPAGDLARSHALRGCRSPERRSARATQPHTAIAPRVRVLIEEAAEHLRLRTLKGTGSRRNRAGKNHPGEISGPASCGGRSVRRRQRNVMSERGSRAVSAVHPGESGAPGVDDVRLSG